MVLDRQREVPIDLAGARDFVRRLRKTMRLGRRDFNVCFVGDREMARLNAAYRGKAKPTDVLSFPWEFEDRNSKSESRAPNFGFRYFLGDIVISAPTASRNARAAGHSKACEIRWLILHGVLHLLGYDHESDRGEMAALEHQLREKLGT